MKLAIITDGGEVIEVMTGIEGYNLNKPMARTEICLQIAETLAIMEVNGRMHDKGDGCIIANPRAFDVTCDACMKGDK